MPRLVICPTCGRAFTPAKAGAVVVVAETRCPRCVADGVCLNSAMPHPPAVVAELAEILDRDERTIYQLAQDSGISRQTIANLLDGSGAKTIEALAAVGAALGYDLTWKRRKR